MVDFSHIFFINFNTERSTHRIITSLLLLDEVVRSQSPKNHHNSRTGTIPMNDSNSSRNISIITLVTNIQDFGFGWAALHNYTLKFISSELCI
jgi:hypothetical protein